MARIDQNAFDIRYLDTLSRGESPLHRLDPRAKLITTLVFVTVVVSFGKYEVSALIPFFIYPVVLVTYGNLPAGAILKRLLPVAPFAVAIGAFNPMMDRDVLMRVGAIEISGGWISFVSVLIRFLLTVGAALLLIALTGFNDVCLALEKLGVPRVFVVQLQLLYRYIFVLVEETVRMTRARALRAFNASASGIHSFGPLVGHLLLRTVDRAQRVHLAMCCRGFDGRIRIMRTLKTGYAEIAFVLGWSTLFVLMRLYNFPRIFGGFITGFF